MCLEKNRKNNFLFLNPNFQTFKSKLQITNSKNNQKAFSLVELIVVFAIVGILVTAISIRIGSNVDSMKLNAATNQIREHILLARDYARATQNRYYVSFNVSGNTYGVYKSSNDNPVIEESSGKNIVYNLNTDEQLGGGNIVAANFGGVSIVEFDARGRPLSGKGGNFLSSEGIVTIGYGTLSSTIRIQPLTGHVSID